MTSKNVTSTDLNPQKNTPIEPISNNHLNQHQSATLSLPPLIEPSIIEENNSADYKISYFEQSQQLQSPSGLPIIKNSQNIGNILTNDYNEDSNSELKGNIDTINHSYSVKHEQPHPQIRKRIFVSYHDKSNGIFGCKHYARNCFIKADCCNQWYVCRFCHDERHQDTSFSINGGRPH